MNPELDVVYVVRPGNRNEELRYSLRSLANLPHRYVWLAGHQPSWVRNVGRIKVAQKRGKMKNQISNLAAACANDDVAEQIVVMNDDFFIVEPISEVPVLNRESLGEVIAERPRTVNEMTRHLLATQAVVGESFRAHDLIHTPFPVCRSELAETLDGIPDKVLWRTYHAWRCNYTGRQWRDVKLRRHDTELPKPFASTSDDSFRRHRLARDIRQLFPDPSTYEES